MQTTVEHHCLPRSAQVCSHCGEMIAPPVFCETCGEDISPAHVCKPQPLDHLCPPLPSPGRCIDCGQPLPASQFCPTCGADITPSHRCPAAPPTHVHRADPVHICPVLNRESCPDCGEYLPALAFCPDCGMEITPAHVCAPKPVEHVCSPLVTMPHRCSHCGEIMPAARHCARCGADITPAHVCADRA